MRVAVAWTEVNCRFAGMTVVVIIMSLKEFVLGEHHDDHDHGPQPAYIRVSATMARCRCI
jgi:hypothetical protein